VIGVLLLCLLLFSCSPPQVEQGDIRVTVIVDGKATSITIPPGSTARTAVEAIGVLIGELDRSAPPLFSVVTEGDEINFIRVVEEFEVEEAVIPFDTQILRNEALQEGEELLIQPGVNGLQEITYRRLFENGEEVNRTVVKTVVITEAVPEVIMVGSQTPFSPVAIAGRLAYLASGNAWVMEENTHNRRPVVTTGDLDGRIFKLSQDGNWLLYTRDEEDEDIINSLHVAKIDGDENISVDLRVNNVIWFADWVPNSNNGLVFSTVEPISTAPGWQANNDLQFISFSENGWVSTPRIALESSSGGVYGWWGTDYAWSPDGNLLAFARPDGIGLVNFEAETVEPIHTISPLQTRSDWAWIPSISWTPDGTFLYSVDHILTENVNGLEGGSLFNVIAVNTDGSGFVSLVPDTGLFAYPTLSPIWIENNGHKTYLVAYLTAILPGQSETSTYRLVVMDRDGSNKQVLFPEDGKPGLEPQRPVWSPFIDQNGAMYIAVVYNGDLWLLDTSDGTQQVTGDGQITVLDWK
jgi:hypothetical protein